MKLRVTIVDEGLQSGTTIVSFESTQGTHQLSVPQSSVVPIDKLDPNKCAINVREIERKMVDSRLAQYIEFPRAKDNETKRAWVFSDETIYEKSDDVSPPRTYAMHSPFTLRDRVIIDNDKSIKGIVTGICFREDVEIEVSWFNSGRPESHWFESWRVSLLEG